MRIPTDQLRRRDDLVDACFESQGEHLDAWHPRTSWATRYSSKFVEAVSELHRLYAANGFANPRSEVLGVLVERGVQSCRGGVITAKQLDYVYEAYGVPAKTNRG